MSKRESIARYNLIIKKLRKRPATFAEIEEYLTLESEIQAYNFNISKRTFQRDRDDIRSLYNIDILFDFSKKVYYIDFDEQPEANERILEAFDTFNALNLTDRLSKHIHFEKRKPQGTEHLYGILHAIKNQIQIKFVYQKYWEDELTERLVEPYALKEFKNRWYVLSKDLVDNKIKSFALDRLTDLGILNKKFNFPKDFDVNEHYRYCFGIISPNGHQPEDVVLSFNAFQGKYIKSLPLHDSQQILIDNEDELRIQLKLFITHDFFMELLSFGENLKVLKPQSLIDDLKSTVRNIQSIYEE
ncbi:putative DNA-binding transcriptional regulator YafY [Sphingobacterium alimentarium]|uniref:Putative DNA-binding transcriptional regulator YafY n=1 Tax=Sphingobacterium alimentarium TaxID=797292 RepID=A0A4R3W122_9SPHI|nr:WYL domain-containing protein [Sphingobacterium alimentarium]TCV20308.1 putative DNA-binding transcriptional regulator YafY [Sphingobacterium alimentarium]